VGGGGGDPDRRVPAGSGRGEEEGKGEGVDERALGVSDWKKKEKKGEREMLGRGR
jgi:hypothetical protein